MGNERMERKITIEEHVLYKEDYQMKMLAYFHEEHSDILDTLEQTKVLTDELAQGIVSAAIAFKGR